MECNIRQRWQASLGKGSIPLNSALEVVPWIIARFSPVTVSDVGCGDGSWLSVFKEKYSCVIDGYDKKYTKNMLIEESEFHSVDLNYGMIPGIKSDICLSLEVGEHLSKSAAKLLIFAVTKISPVVIFASGIPLQGGWRHKNEQWQSYWRDIFAEFGYIAHDDFRIQFWGNPNVSSWYKQDTLIYCKKEVGIKFKLTPTRLFNIVHPDTWTNIGPMGIFQRLKHIL